jgi:hypothetical protein
MKNNQHAKAHPYKQTMDLINDSLNKVESINAFNLSSISYSCKSF